MRLVMYQSGRQNILIYNPDGGSRPSPHCDMTEGIDVGIEGTDPLYLLIYLQSKCGSIYFVKAY